MRKNCAASENPPPGDEDAACRLSRRPWARFALEESFWVDLERICCMQQLSPEANIARAKDYVEAAKGQFPRMRIDNAVRLRITLDMRNQAMRTMPCHHSDAGHPLRQTNASRQVIRPQVPDAEMGTEISLATIPMSASLNRR